MLQIHRPPRRIQMMEGRQPLLDVHAGPELSGRADNDPRQTVVGGLEEAETCLTGLRLVNETDFVRWDAARGELVLQVRVHVGEHCDLLRSLGIDDHSLVVVG